MGYPFVQGLDYGPRKKGTLGIGLHMTEGNGGIGDVTYLARRSGETFAAWRTRIRGVSAHVVILDTGAIYQMVDFDNAAGSFNPADRMSATTGYYHWPIVRDVLGANYVDPNACSIVAEIAGKRANGPNAAQVKATIAWVNDMKGRYPTLRGAFGHHDQTDTKGCPGTTANMLAIFDGIGGHGLWSENPVMLKVTNEGAKQITVADNAPWYDLDGKTILAHGASALDWRNSPFQCGTFAATFATIGGIRRVILVKPSAIRDVPIAPSNCDTEVATAIAEFRNRVVASIPTK